MDPTEPPPPRPTLAENYDAMPLQNQQREQAREEEWPAEGSPEQATSSVQSEREGSASNLASEPEEDPQRPYKKALESFFNSLEPYPPDDGLQAELDREKRLRAELKASLDAENEWLPKSRAFTKQAEKAVEERKTKPLVQERKLAQIIQERDEWKAEAAEKDAEVAEWKAEAERWRAKAYGYEMTIQNARNQLDTGLRPHEFHSPYASAGSTRGALRPREGSHSHAYVSPRVASSRSPTPESPSATKRTGQGSPAFRLSKNPRQSYESSASRLHGVLDKALAVAPPSEQEQFRREDRVAQPPEKGKSRASEIQQDDFTSLPVRSLYQPSAASRADASSGFQGENVDAQTHPSPDLQGDMQYQPSSGSHVDDDVQNQPIEAGDAAASAQAKGKAKDTIKVPLNAVMRDRDNTGWVVLNAGSFLDSDHRKMIKQGSTTLAEYKRMIRNADHYTAGEACLKCLVAAKNRNLCDFDKNGSDHACSRCSRLGHFCQRLMRDDNGELTVAYIPLEEQHRQGVEWGNPLYWARKGLDIPRPQAEPVSRKPTEGPKRRGRSAASAAQSS